MTCIDHGKRGNSKGYATQSHRNKTVFMHRLAYTKHHGIDYYSIVGKVVRHTCDNPRCINPDHLLLGTVLDNVLDRQERQRQARGVTHACAKLVDEDVLYIRSNHVRGCPVNGTEAYAKKFGLSTRSIQSILSRTTWKHI